MKKVLFSKFKNFVLVILLLSVCSNSVYGIEKPLNIVDITLLCRTLKDLGADIEIGKKHVIEGKKFTTETNIKICWGQSKVKEKITVPNVIDKPLSIAKNELISAGFKVSESIAYEESDKTKDTVLSTDPLPGVSLPKDSQIKVTASSGKKEKTIEVKLQLPTEVKNKVEIESYIKGTKNSSDIVIPSEKKEHIIKVTGINGTKDIVIRVNDLNYRKYKVNFDLGTYERMDITDDFLESIAFKDESQVYEDNMTMCKNYF